MNMLNSTRHPHYFLYFKSMGVGSGEGALPLPRKKRLINFFLQNYNIVNKCLRNVNNVTIVNKNDLLSTYEYMCILMQPMHCTGISNTYRRCLIASFGQVCYWPQRGIAHHGWSLMSTIALFYVGITSSWLLLTLDIVQMQLDEGDSSNLDDDDDDDNDMPQLSPVTDISTSLSVYSSSTSATSARNVMQSYSNAGKSVGSKLSTKNAGHTTRLYCICRTPYDETEYAVASFVSWFYTFFL